MTESISEAQIERINGVLANLRSKLLEVCIDCHEIRSMSLTVTWNGNLNTANVPIGLWINSDGSQVCDPAGVVGGLYQTIRMLGTQFGQADALAQVIDKAIVDNTEALMTALEKRQSANEQSQKEKEKI